MEGGHTLQEVDDGLIAGAPALPLGILQARLLLNHALQHTFAQRALIELTDVEILAQHPDQPLIALVVGVAELPHRDFFIAHGRDLRIRITGRELLDAEKSEGNDQQADDEPGHQAGRSITQ